VTHDRAITAFVLATICLPLVIVLAMAWWH
jgi:hypothetical protein